MKYVILILSVFTLYSCNKPGCTNVNAMNFDDKAKEDDGSCDFTTHYAFYMTDSIYDYKGDTMVYGLDSFSVTLTEIFATSEDWLGTLNGHPENVASCNSPNAVGITLRGNTTLYWNAYFYKGDIRYIDFSGNLSANGQCCRLIDISASRFRND